MLLPVDNGRILDTRISNIHFSMVVFSHWNQREINICLGLHERTCLTQGKGFDLILGGAKNRMGYVSQRNQPFGAGAIARMLELATEEAELTKRVHFWEIFQVWSHSSIGVVCIDQRLRSVLIRPVRIVEVLGVREGRHHTH